MHFFDYHAFAKFATEACDHYEKTAPAVRDYVDDVYMRMQDDPGSIRLTEVTFIGRLRDEGEWMHPNYAQNSLMHHLDRLGRSTVGMIDH